MVNGRCYFSRYVQFIATLVQSMSREQNDRVTATPFGHMLSLPYIKQSRPVLDTLLSFWDDVDEGFWFGKVLVPFLGSEFALILGLSATGDEVELYREGRVTSDLIIRFFDGDHKKAGRDAIENRLQLLVGKRGRQDVEDFTKLWVLYLFVTILFPTVHYNVPKALCSYIDDLGRLGSYSWGLAVFAFIRQQIPTISESVRRRNISGNGSGGYMDGCTVALVVWAVEHSNILLGSHRPPFMYPRLLRWSNAKFPRKVIEKLEPREEELHLLSRGRPLLEAPKEISQFPSSSQSEGPTLESLHTRLKVAERYFFLVDKRVSRIEKVLRDNGLLVDDENVKHDTDFTEVSEEHTAVEAKDKGVVEKDEIQDSADEVEVCNYLILIKIFFIIILSCLLDEMHIVIRLFGPLMLRVRKKVDLSP
ncbi:uncharacterized protein LOC120105189 [Phoenix dactylifera]|uniref:Uncharacterized protein LOC120105189 n=1 Tax=Phoenix dactylifera TaxID=42345 RepID=A0A8B8ZP92_PHODC|nr:uncharacterized protein LOC120105189 [Phoenix dactylifera]